MEQPKRRSCGGSLGRVYCVGVRATHTEEQEPFVAVAHPDSSRAQRKRDSHELWKMKRRPKGR